MSKVEYLLDPASLDKLKALRAGLESPPARPKRRKSRGSFRAYEDAPKPYGIT